MADVSHGRGGAGNMNPDHAQYVDGEIVRVGSVGSHGDGAFSSGRGGDGNIVDRGAASTPRNDKELVPDVAVRVNSNDGDHHVGRGGAGNTSREPKAEMDKKEKDRSIDADRRMFDEDKAANGPVRGLADRLKDKFFRRKPGGA